MLLNLKTKTVQSYRRIEKYEIREFQLNLWHFLNCYLLHCRNEMFQNQNGNESNILSNLIVSYFVLNWGRCSGHLTMTNDATDGTRLYTSRVIPQLLPAPSPSLERWWNALQLTSCHYCSSHAALQRPACCSPPLAPVTLLSASRCVTLFCLRS